MSRFFTTKGMGLVLLLGVLALLAAACSGDQGERGPAGPAGAAGAAGADGATVVQTGVGFQVIPPILNYPFERTRGTGVWFIGSGLEPNQAFTIVVETAGLESELTNSLIGERIANNVGGFILGMELRQDRQVGIPEQVQGYGPVNVRLYNADQSVLLATAPWVWCTSDLEGVITDPWCGSAQDGVVLSAPAPPSEFTTWVVDQFILEDGKFELRMAGAAWGYEASQRISSAEGDGIVMTVKVGDTITWDIFTVSGARSSKPHTFGIADMGIEFVPPGRDPHEITFDTAGTFIIDDPTDPGAHGNAKVIVEQ